MNFTFIAVCSFSTGFYSTNKETVKNIFTRYYLLKMSVSSISRTPKLCQNRKIKAFESKKDGVTSRIVRN